MASDDEDLLDDSNFKDLGELEDLDDDAENALLGDSDEEGASKSRERTSTLISNTADNEEQEDEEEQEEVEEEDEEQEQEEEEQQEQEFEYVDEDGNPVEIDANGEVEYFEVSQEDEDEQTSFEESANEFVLDLVVDPDLEFDDSVVQETIEEQKSSPNIQTREQKPKSRAPPLRKKQQQKDDKQEQPKSVLGKALSKLPQHRRQEQQHEHKQQQQQQQQHRKQQQQEQQRKRDQQRKQQLQQIKEQREKQRNQPQKSHRQRQQQHSNIKSKSVVRQKSVEKVEHISKQEESFESTVDEEEEQDYKTSEKNESSESDDEEETGRGRFRTERLNVISLSTAKKRLNIPDTLDAVISHDEAARLERTNRLQSRRPYYGRGNVREQPRDRERNRDREKGRGRDHERSYKYSPSQPHTQEFHHDPAAYTHSSSSIASLNLQEGDSSSNSESKGSRKILINPHFKGSIIPSNEVIPNSNYPWENQPVVNTNPLPTSTGMSEFTYLHQQQQANSNFASLYGAQTNSALTGHAGAQNPLAGHFNFSQPPPAKPGTTFQVPPPALPDFQQGPPPLMSIPPMAPPTGNHLGVPVNLFPPPRDQPPPRLTFNESKLHELQFQQRNDTPWAATSNQHTFKPFSVPPPTQTFPNVKQHNFPNVQQPPPPIPRQQPPPSIPPPSFDRPPPGFDMAARLGTPPPPRSILGAWPPTQQQQRPAPSVPILPIFNRPPPPVNVANNPPAFQITSVPIVTPPIFRPLQQNVNESIINLGNLNQFPLAARLGQQPFAKPQGQNNNLRQLPVQNQAWTKGNLRPIAQQEQPRVYGKRTTNESIASSPLKQVKISHQPLQTNRRVPPINTNITQVQIVDKLPTTPNLPQRQNSQGRNNARQTSNRPQRQEASVNAVQESDNTKFADEDEETRRYRQQIELQKKKREEILRLKEQRRVLMAHQRRKQMLQQSQDPQAIPSTNILPLPIEVASAKPLPIPSSEKVVVSNQGESAVAPNPVRVNPGMTPKTGKKRVVLVRRVAARPYSNLRQPMGLQGSPISIVTNTGSLLGPVPFQPNLPLTQKNTTLRSLPFQQHPPTGVSQTGARSHPNQAPAQKWMQPTAFSNPNLTNITLQTSVQNQPSTIAPKRIIRKPQDSEQPIQQQPQKVANRPVAKVVAIPHRIARQRNLSASHEGIVNVSPKETPRTTNSGVVQRVVLGPTKRAAPPGVGQPEPKRLAMNVLKVPAGTGAAQRHVVPPEQTQAVQAPPISITSTVQIENLAQATNDVQLRKLCSSVGPIESIRVFKEQRRALVKFKNGLHAQQFMARYQRRMVDLSLIAISLVT